ncbi:hypothetical protein, partial [Serratia marcescens]|uniref:hypothetical protein n=1 Tax=Serratia marcescens TaxID=615 RepID=UPI00195460D3
CKGDALPTELIAPSCWSRIIGIVQSESTLFKMISIVRRKFRQGAIIIASSADSLRDAMRNSPQNALNRLAQYRVGVEELARGDTMSSTLFSIPSNRRQPPTRVA